MTKRSAGILASSVIIVLVGVFYLASLNLKEEFDFSTESFSVSFSNGVSHAGTDYEISIDNDGRLSYIEMHGLRDEVIHKYEKQIDPGTLDKIMSSINSLNLLDLEEKESKKYKESPSTARVYWLTVSVGDKTNEVGCSVDSDTRCFRKMERFRDSLNEILSLEIK